MGVDTIPARLFRNAEETPGSPAFFAKDGGSYLPTSWAEYADQVRRAGKALIALGCDPGHHVAILGFNRPEWVIADLACMAAGGAPAGIYTTNSPEEVRYIADHAAVPVIVVENDAQLAKVLEVRDRLPALRTIVTMRGVAAKDDPTILSWDAFLARGDEVDDAAFFARLDGLDPESVGTLIYTSGTTGPPKAVMLTHHNLTWTADMARRIHEFGPTDRLVSYLPLSHIAEQMFTIHVALTNRYRVYFAESIEALAQNLRDVRPTLFFAVPRVWEKFQAGVAAKLSEATGIKERIAEWAQGVGRRAMAARNAGAEPTGLLAVQYRLASKLVHGKVKEALGLDACQFAASGAAPIDASVLEFFAGFDLPVLEVYGQSEGTGPTTFNQPGRTKFGTVGPPFPGTEVKIADDGEILLKGGNVFAGYAGDPAATAATLADGWLYSGDLGHFDDEGFLVITGRKKDIIITAGGKNVAPKNLEGGLKQNPLVSEAVVIGDRRKYLSALITLDAEAAAAFAAARAINGPVHEAAEVHESIQQTVDALNQEVARVEQIKKFRILPRELSIDEGELTGTLKVRRNVVAEHFAPQIEAMYADDSG